MPVGNINIAGRITAIHKLSLQLEAEAATPGASSRELMDIFAKIGALAAAGVKDAADELVDNAVLQLRAGRPV